MEGTTETTKKATYKNNIPNIYNKIFLNIFFIKITFNVAMDSCLRRNDTLVIFYLQIEKLLLSIFHSLSFQTSNYSHSKSPPPTRPRRRRV